MGRRHRGERGRTEACVGTAEAVECGWEAVTMGDPSSGSMPEEAATFAKGCDILSCYCRSAECPSTCLEDALRPNRRVHEFSFRETMCVERLTTARCQAEGASHGVDHLES